MKKGTFHILLKNKRLHLLLFFLYLGVVFVLSLVKFGGDGPSLFFEGFDKIVHFLFYFGMAFLAASFLDRLLSHRLLALFGAFLGSALIGGLIECLQPYFERNCDLNDFIANTAGALIGTLLYRCCQKKINAFFCEKQQ